jgi:hypothetical protein
MSDHHPDLDDLVRAHRKGVRLTTEQHGRNRARILARAAAGAAVATGLVGTTSTAVGTAAATHGTAALVAKILVGVALAGGASTAYYMSRHVSRVEAPIAAHAPLEPGAEKTSFPAAEPSLPVLPAEPPSDPSTSPDVGDVTPGGTASRPAAKVRPETASSLASEVQLLHDVEAALQAGQPARALQLLDSQRGGRFSGAMGEERAAARVVTLCKLGRVDEARAEAVRFVHDRPRSPLVPRVRSTCAKGTEAVPDVAK